MTTTNDLGAPTQSELNEFQAKANKANLAVVKANAAVAHAQEMLAYRQAEATAKQHDVAQLNVEGMQLQQRVQFAQMEQAQAKAAGLVKAPPIPGLRK
jgi:hypothetical protein